MIGLELCDFCKHARRDNTCTAFPSGIPEIMRKGGDHHQPLPGDSGIRFEIQDNLPPSMLRAYESNFAAKPDADADLAKE
jgi:hypothetical protein